MWATDSRDPVIDHHTYKKIAVTVHYYPPNRKYPPEQVTQISEKQFGSATAGDTTVESQILTAVTGYELSEKELDRAGERVWNLMRAIMVQEGRKRKEDTLSELYFKTHRGQKGLSASDFEKAKTEYYRARQWDEATGWPTLQKLNDLNLYDVAQKLSGNHRWPKTAE